MTPKCESLPQCLPLVEAELSKSFFLFDDVALKFASKLEARSIEQTLSLYVSVVSTPWDSEASDADLNSKN